MHLQGFNFPVGNIFCIGRNYAEHAKELGNAVPSEPLVFLKPTSALSPEGTEIRFASHIGSVHHEVEIVLALAATIGPDTPVDTSTLATQLAGMAIGIDVTARDLQDQAKKKGQPWTLSKGLPSFAPVGALVPFRFPAEFELTINGERKQVGRTEDMIFDVVALVRYLGKTFNLRPGDLIFTGTPAGVGPLRHNDHVRASILTTGPGPASELDLKVCCVVA